MRDNDSLIFLLIGEGSNKKRLQKMALDMQLTNVVFAPLQSYDDFPTLLASADVHLVIQKRTVSDSVLPSKLSNILAVGGNAVITADPDTTLGRLFEEFKGIAVLAEPQSIDSLISSIGRALSLPRLNIVALEYAEKNLDKNQILGCFNAELQKLDI